MTGLSPVRLVPCPAHIKIKDLPTTGKSFLYKKYTYNM